MANKSIDKEDVEYNEYLRLFNIKHGEGSPQSLNDIQTIADNYEKFYHKKPLRRLEFIKSCNDNDNWFFAADPNTPEDDADIRQNKRETIAPYTGS